MVTENVLRHRHAITPWLGRTLAGVVEATYLRGERVYARGAADPPPRGRLLTPYRLMTTFTDLVDVAAPRLGGAVLLANDEFFAPKENLLKPEKPAWREGEYTDRGKWMDGWETRRRRAPGHDWCLSGSASRRWCTAWWWIPASSRATFPSSARSRPARSTARRMPRRSRRARRRSGGDPPPLAAPAATPRTCSPSLRDRRVTHLRFNIYPDGGVARLRVYGEPVPDARLQPGVEADLAALQNGGLVVGCSDMFFGHRHNLILPGRSTHMGDGWETKRRRGPGPRLDHRPAGGPRNDRPDRGGHRPLQGQRPGELLAGDLRRARACHRSGFPAATSAWTTLLPRTPLQADAQHQFEVTGRRPPTRGSRSIPMAASLGFGSSGRCRRDGRARPTQHAPRDRRRRSSSAPAAARPAGSMACSPGGRSRAPPICSRRPTRCGAQRAPRTGTRRLPTIRESASVTPRRR